MLKKSIKGFTIDYNLSIALGFLNLLVVPKNKRKFKVFSLRPIDSVVCFNIKFIYKKGIRPNLLRVFPEFAHISPKFCPNLPQISVRICPNFARNMPEFLHRHFFLFLGGGETQCPPAPFLIHLRLIGTQYLHVRHKSFRTCI